DRDVDEVGSEIADRHHLHQTNDQPAGNRAPDISHATDDHGRDALETDQLAHEWLYLAVIQREDHARQRGKQTAGQEDQRYDAVDVDAEQQRGIGIFGDRAQAAAETGAQQYQRQHPDQRNRADEPGKLRKADDEAGDPP